MNLSIAFMIFCLLSLLLALIVHNYKFHKYGGSKGAMFEARIKRLVGEIEISSNKHSGMKIKIYELNRGGTNMAVGFEILSGVWSVFSASFPASEAHKLITLLQAAISDAMPHNSTLQADANGAGELSR